MKDAIIINNGNYDVTEIKGKFVENVTFNEGKTEVRFKSDHESEAVCYKTAWILQCDCDKKDIAKNDAVDVETVINCENVELILTVPSKFNVKIKEVQSSLLSELKTRLND